MDRCCLCERDGKFMNYLLLHCDVASILWNNIFTCFGMSWVMPRSIIDLFVCRWKFERPRSGAIWKMVPICIFVCVWNEINLRCFEDVESFINDILATFFHTLYLWTMVFLSILSDNFVDFLVRFSIPS
jgi:hypothetical protein